jgi:flagellar hook protein FlgE
MSILGAMYSAVSGLFANSNALGIISDNIANANTIGYKETSTNFSTLVTQSGSPSLYAPGGVQSAPFRHIDQQGVLQASSSPTDLAISGGGFFVVNNNAAGGAGNGTYSFTRAGSFTVDASGNLKNAAGLFLQGQRLTTAQAQAIAAGNISQFTATSLSSLQTVNINGIGGTANATTNVAISGANLPAGDTPTSPARTMTVPVFDSQGLEHDMVLSFSRAATPVTPSTETFTVSGMNTGDTYTFTLGGNSYTTAATTGNTLTDVMNALNTKFTAAGAAYTAGISGGNLVITDPSGNSMTGGTLAASAPETISAGTVTNGTTATASTAPFTISGMTTGDTYTATIGGIPYTTAATAGNTAADVANALNTKFTAAGVAYTASASGSTVTITDPSGNSLTGTTLSGSGGETVTAGSVTNGTTATSSTEPFTISNLNTGDTYTFTLGANSYTTAATAGNTLTDVANALNTQFAAAGVAYTASVSGSTVVITDPSGNSLTGGTLTAAAPETVGSGTVTNGTPATGIANTWTVSATMPDAGTTTVTLPAGNTVKFNTDGTLNTAGTDFSTITINWDPTVSGGASPQTVTFDLGTNNTVTGLGQLGGNYNPGTLTQDGVKFGNFTGITVDQNGIVTANFDNGLHQAVYIVPIATFSNPDGVDPATGNTYIQTTTSGTPLLRQAGIGTAGEIAPSSLENSTVDIATEFSNLIVTQRAYEANAKIITTSDQMLQTLINMRQ